MATYDYMEQTILCFVNSVSRVSDPEMIKNEINSAKSQIERIQTYPHLANGPKKAAVKLSFPFSILIVWCKHS